jgi:hypothetical protein
MTEPQHRDAARGRWWRLSLAEQFGNVGSEISRAIRWSTKNPETPPAALYRALELFDLMLADPRHRASVARLREIARAPRGGGRFSRGGERVRLDRPFAAEVLRSVRARRAPGLISQG